QRVDQWQSAMTYKFVGAIRDLDHLESYKLTVMQLGLALGVVSEILRKVLRRSRRYQAFTRDSRAGFAFGWLMDAVLLASPYALSFGGFVEFPVALWFAAGGCLTSLINTLVKRRDELD